MPSIAKPTENEHELLTAIVRDQDRFDADRIPRLERLATALEILLREGIDLRVCAFDAHGDEWEWYMASSIRQVEDAITQLREGGR